MVVSEMGDAWSPKSPLRPPLPYQQRRIDAQGRRVILVYTGGFRTPEGQPMTDSPLSQQDTGDHGHGAESGRRIQPLKRALTLGREPGARPQRRHGNG